MDRWSLTLGGRVLLTAPRGAIVRRNLNHRIHHRGRLTVHLRLLDVPLPSIRGPTADEGWSGGALPAERMRFVC